MSGLLISCPVETLARKKESRIKKIFDFTGCQFIAPYSKIDELNALTKKNALFINNAFIVRFLK
jgi:hypothetical protein